MVCVFSTSDFSYLITSIPILNYIAYNQYRSFCKIFPYNAQIIRRTDKKASEWTNVIKFYSQNFQESIQYMVTSLLSAQEITDRLDVMK